MNEKNKILLITGASSDIGVELIRTIEKNYVFILAHYNSSHKTIESLQQEYGKKIIPVKADLSSYEDVLKMIDFIKSSEKMPCHIVHLAAPRTFNQRFHKCNWGDYQNVIDIALRSIVVLLQTFMPYMAKTKYGKIVFMLSAYLIGVPPKYQSPYITVKYALYGLMRNLAAEYASKGITVNGVSPDMIETKFLNDIENIIIQKNAENNPLKRNLNVNDVIPTIQYLLSDGADIVTGQNIGVTGGIDLNG